MVKQMTLQERMIAAYLRQANLLPEEKMKLKLFLGLLLVTFDTDCLGWAPIPEN